MSDLEKIRAKSNTEKIPMLGVQLLKFGRKVDSPPDSRWVEFFELVRKEFVEVPGHGESLREELVKLQESKSDGGWPASWNLSDEKRRHEIMTTLQFSASPEALFSLGRLLEDDFWKICDQPPGSSVTERIPRSTSVIAATAIARSRVRSRPASEKEFFPYKTDEQGGLENTLAWWEEIKSGDLAFSFIGQKEEYRFRSDGTWETSIRSVLPNEVPRQQWPGAGTETMRPSADETEDHPLGWLVGLAGALGLAGIWFLRGKRGKGLRAAGK